MYSFYGRKTYPSIDPTDSSDRTDPAGFGRSGNGPIGRAFQLNGLWSRTRLSPVDWKPPPPWARIWAKAFVRRGEVVWDGTVERSSGSLLRMVEWANWSEFRSWTTIWLIEAFESVEAPVEAASASNFLVLEQWKQAMVRLFYEIMSV